MGKNSKNVKLVFRSAETNKKLFTAKISRETYDRCIAALRPGETFEDFMIEAIHRAVRGYRWQPIDSWSNEAQSFQIATGEHFGDASMRIRVGTTSLWVNLQEEDRLRLIKALTEADRPG